MAPEMGAAPGYRASGVWPTISPMPVASRMVQVVAEIMFDVGRYDASQDEPAAASSPRLSQTSTLSGVVGPVAFGSSTTRSPLDCARVKRLNTGASLAREKRKATHSEKHRAYVKSDMARSESGMPIASLTAIMFAVPPAQLPLNAASGCHASSGSHARKMLATRKKAVKRLNVV